MAEAEKNQEDGAYNFKVNGIEFEIKRRIVLAREILEIAAKQGAMPGKPDEYVLEGDKGRYEADSKIDLAEDNIFITLPIKAPQVA